ncbi:uncharacterized protein LOC120350642 [Nilaparvata lugens]|uniref:uncharacterized protein LOC120350642 n=1 Tax=Nilaparvata lugens TaxID=108931 RepID=UPI00193D0D1E|nr:uncharacterized protein LOC120350642 [Nilaparvata lugens]
MAANHSMSSTKLVFTSFTLITLLCVVSSVCGSPAPLKPPGFHDGASIAGYEDLEDKCNTVESVQILCQTCAKVTKSEIVYPMCCTNKEDARIWCDRYTSFGIQ